MIANVLYALVILASLITLLVGYTPAVQGIQLGIICLCVIHIAFGRRLK